MLNQVLIALILLAVALLLGLLFLALGKSSYWSTSMMSSFECGFSSYFYSRFSFSIHYFLVGLIFLFLDLELCLLMPFLAEILDSNQSLVTLSIFILVLLGGLLYEWINKKLDWSF